MGSLVTIRLRENDARAAKARQPWAMQVVHVAICKALERRAFAAERKAARTISVKARGAPPKRERGWPTPKLRETVWKRSEGRCENPACGRQVSWNSFHLDHFLGRGKAAQLPENTWALCGGVRGFTEPESCHVRKHAGDPSRLYWLEQFLEFAGRRFAGSPTVAKVEAEIAAERVRAQLDERLRRKRVAHADVHADPLNLRREPHDEKTVEAFYDSTLGPEERSAFERHLATCEECDRKLSELMQMSTLMERRAAPGGHNG